MFFSGLNFNSSIKLKMHIFKAQLNKLPTKYKKLLQLDNKEYTNERLEVLLKALYPICFYTEGHEQEFRDKALLVKFLCDDCESLRDFYEEIKNDNQQRTDLL